MRPAEATGSRAAAAPKSRLWLWFVAAFLIQITVWSAWLVIASKHKVQEIPLQTPGQTIRPAPAAETPPARRG